MNKIRLFLSLLLFTGMSILNATDPVVSNVTASQRTDGSKIVDIWYDLEFTEVNSVFIVLMISEDAGVNFNIKPTTENLSGDVRTVSQQGTGKHIIWNMGAESRTFDSENYVFKTKAYIFAPPAENFVLVEGGTFYNGTSDVTVSSFYMDKYELTQSDYQALMGGIPNDDWGVGSDYPVYTTTWFNAIEYCNRRSMQEGLTPCYSHSTNGTDPDNWPVEWDWNTDTFPNIVSCNWTAGGYRLPTEAEWEFAARGGIQTHNYTYSGSNTIGEVAWYQSNTSVYHHAVGTKANNELGIYDMSGNVKEWIWDIYSSYPTGAQTNPHGASSGPGRMKRGGASHSSASLCAVSYRGGGQSASYLDHDTGFRCVRRAE